MSIKDSIDKMTRDIEPNIYAADLLADTGTATSATPPDAAGTESDWDPPSGTFAQFIGKKPPPIPWLVSGFIPYGYQPIMLAGAPGSSKSLLGAQLCREVSLGRDFFNMPTTQTRGLYISFEDNEQDLFRRASGNTSRINPESIKELEPSFMYLGREDFCFCLKNPKTGRLMEGPGYGDLLEWVIKHDVHFIVGDHLSKFFQENENDRGLVNAFGALLTRFCEDAKCQWLMLSHTNKAGLEYSGSSANAGIYRQVLLLTQSDDGIYTLECKKSNHTKAGKKLFYTWDDWYCQPLSDDDVKTRRSEAAARREAQRAASRAAEGPDPASEAVVSIMEPGRQYTAEELISLAGLGCSVVELGKLVKGDQRIDNKGVRTIRGKRKVCYSLAHATT